MSLYKKTASLRFALAKEFPDLEDKQIANDYEAIVDMADFRAEVDGAGRLQAWRTKLENDDKKMRDYVKHCSKFRINPKQANHSPDGCKNANSLTDLWVPSQPLGICLDRFRKLIPDVPPATAPTCDIKKLSGHRLRNPCSW